jgi:hypothetical protein
MVERTSKFYRFLMIDEFGTVREIQNGQPHTARSAMDHARGMMSVRPGIRAIEVWHSDRLMDRFNR